VPPSGIKGQLSVTRFLWDELLPYRVPRALRELGLNTSYVGNTADGAPARGSTDETIIEYSQRTNQIIVTSNHDMILLCAETGQRFVWLDPRGKQFGGVEHTLLVLRQIRAWDSILAGDPILCVRSRRTKCDSISPEEAARLAAQRMKSLQKRRRIRKPAPLGPFVEDDH
jgi:predicted nuclease of predicted toxin-antitoxin system